MNKFVIAMLVCGASAIKISQQEAPATAGPSFVNPIDNPTAFDPPKAVAPKALVQLNAAQQFVNPIDNPTAFPNGPPPAAKALLQIQLDQAEPAPGLTYANDIDNPTCFPKPPGAKTLVQIDEDGNESFINDGRTLVQINVDGEPTFVNPIDNPTAFSPPPATAAKAALVQHQAGQKDIGGYLVYPTMDVMKPYDPVTGSVDGKYNDYKFKPILSQLDRADKYEGQVGSQEGPWNNYTFKPATSMAQKGALPIGTIGGGDGPW